MTPPTTSCPLLLFLLTTYLPHPTSSWRRWDYTTQTDPGYVSSARDTDISSNADEWKKTWKGSRGPGSRRGHSIVLLGTKLVLFGGRSNEGQKSHVPKSYKIADVDGILEFETYDDRPVSPLYNETAEGCGMKKECQMVGGEETCSYAWEVDEDANEEDKMRKEAECGYVPIGLYYNDVWEYNLDCTRYADMACSDRGWEVLNPGVVDGGCQIFAGNELCTTPSERWHHGAAMFDDKTMLIYGGFSQRCEDYCDDMWSFDTRDNSWMEIYPIGHFQDGESPGKRWKFSLLSGVTNKNTGEAGMVFFGGHRLWHGFDQNNFEGNLWNNTNLYPSGGYLNDLWIYTKRRLDEFTQVPIDSSGYGEWEQKLPIGTTFDDPGITWASRNDKRSETLWPKERAGHIGIFDSEREGFWIHGGFTSYFPYISTDGPGSGIGVQSSKLGGGFTPYPTYPFYLDDLWFYNLTSYKWTEFTFSTEVNPDRRTDHIMIISGNILIMFGGYYNNHHYDDTWYFNITSDGDASRNEGRWRQKKRFVWADWPDTCVDDWEYIYSHPECKMMTFPEDLSRALADDKGANAMYVKSGVLPAYEQPDYYPDHNYRPSYMPPGSNWTGQYYGIHDDATAYMLDLVERHKDENGIVVETPYSEVLDGSPMAPKAATSLRQYAREIPINSISNLAALFASEDFNNSKHDELENGVVWEYCTSAVGEPTRGKVTDGLFGRADESVFIKQPRRQRYGWDGCTRPDRELWTSPTSRSDHTAVFVEDFGTLLFFGGVGYVDPLSEATLSVTHETEVLGDFWQFNINVCNNNCSNNGICNYGDCFCDPGFYGIDCSNSSCPGDFCYYDEFTKEQVCSHCCYSGHVHTDDDIYLADVKKDTCNLERQGASNGICDGYGTCQCQPPFIGEDCSIKDCKYDCSFNGYCSVEFPVSRCMCNPGYFGEYCQYRECLNNCSFPNGLCDFTTGECTCHPLYNPYNNLEKYAYWGGLDCSYLLAFCAGCNLKVLWGLLSVLFLTVSVLLL